MQGARSKGSGKEMKANARRGEKVQLASDLFWKAAEHIKLCQERASAAGVTQRAIRWRENWYSARRWRHYQLSTDTSTRKHRTQRPTSEKLLNETIRRHTRLIKSRSIALSDATKRRRKHIQCVLHFLPPDAVAVVRLNRRQKKPNLTFIVYSMRLSRARVNHLGRKKKNHSLGSRHSIPPDEWVFNEEKVGMVNCSGKLGKADRFPFCW